MRAPTAAASGETAQPAREGPPAVLAVEESLAAAAAGALAAPGSGPAAGREPAGWGRADRREPAERAEAGRAWVGPAWVARAAPDPTLPPLAPARAPSSSIWSRAG